MQNWNFVKSVVYLELYNKVVKLHVVMNFISREQEQPIRGIHPLWMDSLGHQLSHDFRFY